MDESFFDRISDFYDDMIDFHTALERRSAVLKDYIISGMEYAADIGCGTGLDSISLARAGLKVRAFDPSSGMIDQAQKNAENYGVKVKFYNSAFKDLPVMFDSSFDLVVSLGNTIANIPESDIDTSFSRLYNILKPGGRVVIQILNYERIKKLNDRIVNITRKESNYFIRFYDFLDQHINFNIISFNADNPKERTMNTAPLFPYSTDFLQSLFGQSGFKNIEIFGNLSKEEFNRQLSGDLIISAYK